MRQTQGNYLSETAFCEELLTAIEVCEELLAILFDLIGLLNQLDSCLNLLQSPTNQTLLAANKN